MLFSPPPPCSGGPRKCVGDQFALMEAVAALAVVLKRFDFSPQVRWLY